jgi:hypothetical protein
MRTLIFTTALVAALSSARFAAAEPMGTGFTYQGHLNDGGAPATGLYDLTFTLHDDPSNVASVGTYIVLSAVPITNGLFTVELNSAGEFGANAFNGEARWLQIGVRTNTNIALKNFTFLAPRQLLTAAPHALFAANAAQAGTANSAAVANSVAWANITGIPADFADGVDNGTQYTAGAGLTLSGGNEFSVNFAGSGAADTTARSDHEHFGAKWSGSTAFGAGVCVTNNANSGAGLYGQQGTGSGFPYIFGNIAGVWGESSQGSGVHGATGRTNGVGVLGLAVSLNGTNAGVRGITISPNGVGVLAEGSGTNGTALRISHGGIRVTGAGSNTATAVFVHELTTNNVVIPLFGQNIICSFLDNPYCNDAPDAILVVTPSMPKDPFSIFLPTVPVPVFVFYDKWGNEGPPGRWCHAASVGQLALAQRYNVMVINP